MVSPWAKSLDAGMQSGPHMGSVILALEQTGWNTCVVSIASYGAAVSLQWRRRSTPPSLQ